MNLNEKYIERFEQLIRVMRSLTPHERRRHFDMEFWGFTTDCGTTMCAAGHAGSDPWFRRRGFKLSKDPLYRSFDIRSGNDLMSWDAVLDFFGHMPEVDGTNSRDHAWGDPNDVSKRHPVFSTPKSVGEVIRAAKARIKLLKAQS